MLYRGSEVGLPFSSYSQCYCFFMYFAYVFEYVLSSYGLLLFWWLLFRYYGGQKGGRTGNVQRDRGLLYWSFIVMDLY